MEATSDMPTFGAVTRDLRALPKAHLHLHLEGAMRAETLSELATGYGMAVPEIRGFGSFTAFAGMYLAACAVLQTEDDIQRIVDEVVEDNALAGAAWVEPAFYLPRYRDQFGGDQKLLELLIDALTESTARHGLAGGWIVAADRTVDPHQAVEQARLAAMFAGRGVVGFGLANDEALFPPEPFAEAYAIAKNGGLLSVPHAGELAGPESIIGALDELGADRIQHGVRAVEDPRLVERLAETSVCLDVCPTSNLMLAVCASLDEHPLPALLDAGVRCSINGDDPLLFGPNLLEEYELLRTGFGFDDNQIAGIARYSIEASGAPEAVKRQALAGIETWLAADEPVTRKTT
jgi:adenosine deaminase